MIKMIACVSSNGVIGQNNKLPFNYPEDMKFFRKMTASSTIIMGRKTWESIGRLLPKRRNIVISRNKIDVDGLETFPNITSALLSERATPVAEQNIWLIGGASIYGEGMVYADEIFLTLAPDIIEGEGLILFPWVDPSKFKAVEYITLEGSKLKVVKYVREAVVASAEEVLAIINN